MKILQRSYQLRLARFSGRLLLATVHLLVGVILAWLLLWFYPGDRWWPVLLGSYFSPWLFLMLFPALLVAWLGRRRRLTGLIILLILVLGFNFGPQLLPRLSRVQAEAHTTELRVMTFNVHFANRNASAIARLIQTEQPDLIAFQEFTPDLAQLLLPELESAYPYYLVDNSWTLPMVLVSRYPLEAQPKPAGADRAQHAIVQTPTGPITLWNMHPTPALDQATWQEQRETLLLVAGEIRDQAGPIIILGDFNTTNQAENFQILADHLLDVNQAVGRGFGFTFPEPTYVEPGPWYLQPLVMVGPVMDIDHIMVSQHFTPRGTHIIAGNYGSDHRPVVATLDFAAAH